MKEKSFDYLIPAAGMKDSERRTTKAWKTTCPGLIIQRPLGEELQFSHLCMVHEKSGFITKYVLSLDEGHKWAEAMKHLAIDWTVKNGWEIHQLILQFATQGGTLTPR